VVAAALLLGGTSEVGAQSKGSGKGNRSSKGSGSQVGQQIVQELRQARQLLKQANHNYQGHRVNAMKYITQALHALHPPKGKKPPQQPQGTGGQPQQASSSSSPGNAESQQQSDSQVRQALTLLQQSAGQLAGSRAANRYQLALSDIRQAIQEVQAALNVK
jgi:type VI protein secretion system component VasF